MSENSEQCEQCLDKDGHIASLWEQLALSNAIVEQYRYSLLNLGYDVPAELAAKWGNYQPVTDMKIIIAAPDTNPGDLHIRLKEFNKAIFAAIQKLKGDDRQMLAAILDRSPVSLTPEMVGGLEAREDRLRTQADASA